MDASDFGMVVRAIYYSHLVETLTERMRSLLGIFGRVLIGTLTEGYSDADVLQIDSSGNAGRNYSQWHNKCRCNLFFKVLKIGVQMVISNIVKIVPFFVLEQVATSRCVSTVLGELRYWRSYRQEELFMVVILTSASGSNIESTSSSGTQDGIVKVVLLIQVAIFYWKRKHNDIQIPHNRSGCYYSTTSG